MAGCLQEASVQGCAQPVASPLCVPFRGDSGLGEGDAGPSTQGLLRLPLVHVGTQPENELGSADRGHSLLGRIGASSQSGTRKQLRCRERARTPWTVLCVSMASSARCLRSLDRPEERSWGATLF